MDTVELIAGALPRRQQRFVEAWAELHQEELLEDWSRLQSGHPPFKIDPLQHLGLTERQAEVLDHNAHRTIGGFECHSHTPVVTAMPGVLSASLRAIKRCDA